MAFLTPEEIDAIGETPSGAAPRSMERVLTPDQIDQIGQGSALRSRQEIDTRSFQTPSIASHQATFFPRPGPTAPSGVPVEPITAPDIAGGAAEAVQEYPKNVGKILSLGYAGAADVTSQAMGLPKAQADATGQTEPDSWANIKAVLNEEDLPMDQIIRQTPGLPGMLAKAGKMWLDLIPRIYLMRGFGAAGMGPATAGALAFGTKPTGSGIDPVGAALGALMPGVQEVGRTLGGSLADSLMRRGLINAGDKFTRNLVEEVGGVGAIQTLNEALNSPQLYQLYQQDPHQFWSQIGADTLGSAAFMLVGARDWATGPGPWSSAFMRAVEKTYTPEDLKDIYLRVNRGEATQEEQQIVRFINTKVSSPGEAIRGGATIRTETPIFTSPFWQKFFGLAAKDPEIRLTGAPGQQPPAAPAATAAPQPRPGGRPLLLGTGEADATTQEQQPGSVPPQRGGTIPQQPGQAPGGTAVAPADTGNRLPGAAGSPPGGIPAGTPPTTPTPVPPAPKPAAGGKPPAVAPDWKTIKPDDISAMPAETFGPWYASLVVNRKPLQDRLAKEETADTLAQHLAAATTGAGLVRRMAEAETDPAKRQDLMNRYLAATQKVQLFHEALGIKNGIIAKGPAKPSLPINPATIGLPQWRQQDHNVTRSGKDSYYVPTTGDRTLWPGVTSKRRVVDMQYFLEKLKRGEIGQEEYNRQIQGIRDNPMYGKPEPVPPPAAPKWKDIGPNSNGDTVFEDDNGVRSILRGSVRVTEPVRMIPTREGVQTATGDRTGTEFETATEARKRTSPEAGNALRALVNSAENNQQKAAEVKRLADKEGVTVKQMQERIEAEVVKMANETARRPDLSPKEKFQELIALYNRQPVFSARTSTSVENQAYSTPAPIAFATGYMADVGPSSSQYDGTGGNGMLLIGGDIAHSWANELDPARQAALKALGVGIVTGNDATTFRPNVKYDVVRLNPPFGSIGNTLYDGFGISKLEHLIALKSLEAMKNDGTAAVILGATMQPQQKVVKGAQWVFENYLYGHYHVAANFEVSGDLYAKQGTKWPIRVIIIAGRRATPLTGELAPASVQRLGMFDELWTQAERTHDDVVRAKEALVSGREPGLPVPAGAKPGPAKGQTPVPLPPTGPPGTPGKGGKPQRGGGGKPTPAGKPTGGLPGQPPVQAPGGPGGTPPTAVQPGAGGDKTVGVEGGTPGKTGAPGNAPGAGGGAGKEPQPGKLPGKGPVRGGRKADDLSGMADDELDNLLDAAVQENQPAPAQAPKAAPAPKASTSGQRGGALPGGKAQAPKPAPAPKLSDAAKDAAKAFDEGMKGLNDLFGGGGLVGSGPAFNEDTYQKAKGHFKQAYDAFVSMGRTLKEFVAECLRRWGNNVRDYIRRFIKDMQAEQEAKTEIEPGKANALQDVYEPRSEATPLGTLTPKNISVGEHAALDALKARVGSLDNYVADKLNMQPDEVKQVLAGEQVDGVAQGINQVETGGAVIIGDQTGIGKGRQGAGMLRYGIVNGAVAVFMTKDPKLFSDMHGDLADIHTQIRPFIMGSPAKASIVGRDGQVIHRAPGLEVQRREMARILQGGWANSGYNCIFLTYSQVNDRNERQQFLERLAATNPTLIVMDEAHEAAGDSGSSMQAAFITGGQVQRGSGAQRKTITVPGLLNQQGTRTAPGGVVYMSATFAKRPENMACYFRTALSRSAQNFNQIVQAMKRGGVALQQAVSEALAKAGQYMRRERDFSGVRYDMKTIKVAGEGALKGEVDEVTEVLSQIVDFSHKIRDRVQAQGGGASSTAMTAAQQDMTDFAAIVHNQISQLLLAAKADAVVQEAIAAKAKGEKPVIALMNTMETFLDNYTTDHDIQPGHAIKLGWQELLKYALTRTLRVTEKLPNGDKNIYSVDPEEFGLGDAYRAVEAAADAISSKFPVSPIDYIIQRLKAAGVSMVELTGRQSGIEYTDFEKNEGIYRTFKKANKNQVVNGFNGGKYDGMLLNASGSTGLSAHASTTFDDKRPRHMMIVQPALDINVFIQTLGRILRTGMVKLGLGEDGQPYGARYSHLVLPLQAELRPAAMAAKKMKSLNANTTAEADAAIKIEAEDIFNRYGDRICAEFLDQHPDIQRLLELPIDVNDDGTVEVPRDVARKMTGRMALMPDEDQRKAYEELMPAYRTLIEQLKATGEYDLEIVVHDDWDGIQRDDQELQAGTDDSNIFTAGVRMQRWEVRDMRHVPTGQEMESEFKRVLGSKAKVLETWREVRVKGDKRIEDAQATLARQQAEWDAADKRKDQMSEAEAQGHMAQGVHLAGMRGIVDSMAHRWDHAKGLVDSLLERAGQVVELTNPETGDAFNGMLVDVKYPTGKRYTMAAFRFKFLLHSPGGVAYITGAQFGGGLWNIDQSDKEVADLGPGDKNARYQRWFITGNPIGGYVATGGRGKMVRFKSQDERTITGLMMPTNWGPQNLANDPRLDLISGAAVRHFLNNYGMVGRNGVPLECGNVCRLTRQSWGSRSYTISVPAARSTGSPIYLDRELRRTTGDFTKTGSRMTANVDDDDINKVADRIMAITKARFRPVGDTERLIPQVSESNRRGRPRQGALALRQAGGVDVSMEGKTFILSRPGVPIQGLPAFHGTPHDVDRFSLDKIGTGEGAQVYGWGLYFAERAEVAHKYRKALTLQNWRSLEDLASLLVTETGGDKQAAKDLANTRLNQSHIKAFQDVIPLIDSAKQRGSLYSVDLDVEPEQLLNWDKPYIEQSPEVRRRLEESELGPWIRANRPNIGNIYERLSELFKSPAKNLPDWVIESEMFRGESMVGSDKKASEFLNSLGIKGIRYLDQGSRSLPPVQVVKMGDGKFGVLWGSDPVPVNGKFYETEEQAQKVADDVAIKPTYNYVIFDENSIKITHKNGEPVTADEMRQASLKSAADNSQEAARAGVREAMGPSDLRRMINAPDAGLPDEAVNLLNEFLDSPLADYLEGVRLRIADTLADGWQGSYFEKLAELARTADPLTGIHEFLHRIWEILPPDIQKEFERLRVEGLRKMLEEAVAAGQMERAKAIQDLIARPTAGAEEFLARGYPSILLKDLYPYSSAEENFTHSGSARFKERVGSMVEGFWSRVKQIISDFIAALKKALRLKQNQAQWLDNVLRGNFDPAEAEDVSRVERQGALGATPPEESERAAAIKRAEVEEEQEQPGVPTQVFGTVDHVRAREQITPSSMADSIAHAESVFKQAGVPFIRETNGLLTIQQTGFEMNAEGRKLLDLLRQEIATKNQPGKAGDLLADLLNTIVYNFHQGTMSEFERPLREELYELAQSDRSQRGLQLGALALFRPDLDFVAKNVDVVLHRVYSDAFGGTEIASVLKRVMENFRQYFTDDEIRAALASAPGLVDLVDKIIALNRRDEGGRVYRRVQAMLKPKNKKKLSALEGDARVQEAVDQIIENARLLGIEPQKSPNPKLSPLHRLLLMVTPGNADKIDDLISRAVAEGERNAGIKWALRQTKTPDERAEAEARFAAGEEPTEDMVEQGLDLPEFAHWRALRDDLLGYEPTTLKLVQDLIRGDFKGTRFGKPENRPADTRLDLNKLATQPEEEVRRVLDAYLDNIEANMDVRKADEDTQQRVREMVEREVAHQLEQARERFRSPMFAPPKDPRTALTPQQQMAKLVNAGLFRDPRANLAEMVQRVAAKSRVARLTPGLPDLVKQVFQTPFYRQSDLAKRFADDLVNRLGVAPEQAQKAAEVFAQAFDSRFTRAKELAQKQVVASFTPLDRSVIKPGRPIWQKIERAVNAGVFDAGEVLREIARSRGWSIPTDAQIAKMKALSEREQRLRDLTTAEQAAAGDRPEDIAKAKAEKAAATLEERAALHKQMGVMWSRMTRPISWAHWWSTRRNFAAALNELETGNLLLKVGFPFRLGIHILTQGAMHTPTRAMAAAVERWLADRSAARETNLWRDLHQAVSDAYKQRLAAWRPALVSARAALAGRGEARNVDRLMTGIQALERASSLADELSAQGKFAQAFVVRLVGLVRLSFRFCQAWDNLQGTPAEFQEMREQVITGLREMGRTPAEAQAQADQVMGNMGDEWQLAYARAQQIFEGNGLEATPHALSEAAWEIVKSNQYLRMQALGLPADAFLETNRLLRSTLSWQERAVTGLGGVVAGVARGATRLGEHFGVPLGFTRFGNAIGTGINYMLMFTPLYSLASVNLGQGAGGSTWFRTEKDRHQRRIQALLGTICGSALLLLAALGIIRVRNNYPKDKNERDAWERSGRKPHTVEIPVGDNQSLIISTIVGPFAAFGPYLGAGGAIRDLLDNRAKQQAKLNTEAAARGLPAGKIRPVDMADMLEVAAAAGEQALMGNRTLSGLAASVTDYGSWNLPKLVASQMAPLVPGLPGYQEASRLAGVNLDAKMASFWDFLVPLPSSQARAVNMLGQPVTDENDARRIVQILTGGTYPVPTDTPTAQAVAEYGALFSTGFRPPAVEPNRGYAIGGDFRPMNDQELARYTQIRGDNLRNALASMGSNPDPADVQAAYKVANQEALQAVGVDTSSKAPTAGRQTGQPAQSQQQAPTPGTPGSPAGTPSRTGVAARGGGIRLGTRGGALRRPPAMGRMRPPGMHRAAISGVRARAGSGIGLPRGRGMPSRSSAFRR